MEVERYIRAIAGTFVLTSLALGHLVSPYWYLFTAFVGFNLLQSSFTQWCPMERFLANLESARSATRYSGNANRPNMSGTGCKAGGK